MTKPTLSQLRRLVGNPDAYAVQQVDGSYRPVREPLTDEVLGDHLALVKTVGTYIGHNVDDFGALARTLVFDIDDGSEPPGPIPSCLADLGVPVWSIGVEDSGRKGFHVWMVLQDFVPCADLRRLGRSVSALAGFSGEVFPKQDAVRDLGNLVKLPGGQHMVTGNRNDFIGDVPRPMAPARWEQVLGQLPPELHARRSASEVRFPCLTAIQEEGCQEGSRNIQLFHLAAMLRRAGVSDENTELIVARTNEMGDPLDYEELSGLLESSKQSGPLCNQLPEDRKCGELCLLTRTAGLYTRPGQLRYAAEGENVVVTLSGRKGRVVEFAHDDIGEDGKMKAVLHGD